MHDFARGFRIDGALVEWGATLAAAAEMFGLSTQECSEIGYETLRVPCKSAYGFQTLVAEVTAYGLSRPVTALAYELAPPAGGPIEPRFWTGPLTAMLGRPSRESIEDVSDRSNPWDAVRYYAGWQSADFSVGLSVYGALREVPEGRSAGTLWLNWPIEKAARPYLEEWRAACDALKAAAKGASGIRTFRIGFDQHATHSDGSEPVASAPRPRDAQLALTTPDILRTPAVIAERLGPRDFSLWSNPDRKLRCLSTRWDSVTWTDDAPPVIDWLHVRPAKGPGQSSLRLGHWSVIDAVNSSSVRDAVAALEALPRVRVNRVDGGYDC
jgi:hypothetical protein